MSIFKFKKFNVHQDNVPQKVGTDAMVLGAMIDPSNQPKKILDVGTGCGVIALMLAQKYPGSQVTGLDIDEKAIAQAKINFEEANRGQLNADFSAIHQDFLSYSPDLPLDLIVSNPPYFNTKMPSENEQRSLARHENSMSLEGFIDHSTNLLSDNGELWMIIPAERTASLVESSKILKLIRQIRIFGKPGRHVRDVVVFSKRQPRFIESSLTIRDDENNYTEEYKELTIDFHFNQL
ncbi:tRNA1(Val) (adenine(37)-N6)-methyltransferase [Brumimicrobium aurantiacum]|uniref:Methyltransferase domain-containing protein n=1 Tax=Brumimicrobium aurantiacum TaxID=1737063 RepID=A0A3E1EYV4_9FLAO|nr:methyltransferase [Brumimicrobium aurantiacum]RFC54751.1 methyltransferase domain-containing protein [Brumimicrobium aurantiacum]